MILLDPSTIHGPMTIKGYRYENKVASAALKDYMKQTDQKAKISAINQYYVEQMIKCAGKIMSS